MKPTKIIDVKNNGERIEGWECSKCHQVYKDKVVCEQCCGYIPIQQELE